MKGHSHILPLLFFSILMGKNVFSQDNQFFKEVLVKTEAFYKNTQSYSIETKYEYFETQNASQPLETLEGFIFKNNTNYFSKIGTTDFVYIQDVFLKLDHAEKAVIYSKSEGKNSFLPIELSSMVAHFESIVATSNKNEIVFDLSFKKELSIPYTKMVLLVNSKTFEINRQELYFKENQKFPWTYNSEKPINEAKMIITLTPSNKNYPVSLLSLSNYISNSKTLKLSQKFDSYKLYNLSQ